MAAPVNLSMNAMQVLTALPPAPNAMPLDLCYGNPAMEYSPSMPTVCMHDEQSYSIYIHTICE
jgi:hypothetical protein